MSRHLCVAVFRALSQNSGIQLPFLLKAFPADFAQKLIQNRMEACPEALPSVKRGAVTNVFLARSCELMRPLRGISTTLVAEGNLPSRPKRVAGPHLQAGRLVQGWKRLRRAVASNAPPSQAPGRRHRPVLEDWRPASTNFAGRRRQPMRLKGRFPKGLNPPNRRPR